MFCFNLFSLIFIIYFISFSFYFFFINFLFYSDTKTREEENKKHDDFVNEFRKKNNVLKEEIKTKLSSHFK